MSLIPPQQKIERQAMSIRLEVALARTLKLYAEWIHSSQEWVVNEGLRLTFAKDQAFQSWLRSEHAELAQTLGDSPRARGRRARVSA